MRRLGAGTIPAAWLVAGSLAAAEPPAVLHPAAVTLRGPGDQQTLVLERRDAAGAFTGAVDATFTVANPQVAAVEKRNGSVTLRPLADGQTTVTASWTEGKTPRTAKTTVTVTGAGEPAEWRFGRHGQPVLTKLGCNSGACHGAIAGKNGFRLSLRGFANEQDHAVLTRQVQGRRVNLRDPGKSLLLTKPLTVVPHGGGRRLEETSREFRVLADWIAAGAPGPSATDESAAKIVKLEVFPPAAVLTPGAAQPLAVTATFADGTAEDVTPWVKYTSTDAAVCNVDDGGRVAVQGHGEGAVTAWYLNQLAVATVTVPYPAGATPPPSAATPSSHLVDRHVDTKLRALNLPASPPADDATFLRRASLDITGALPTAAEVKAFLADRDPAKRGALIDRLLAAPGYVDYWSYRWSDLLLVSSDKLKTPAMWAYYRWVRRQVAANAPWDRMVRELLTARGSNLDHGAANFFVLHPDPMELSETVATAFLGLPINCARCHNHPLEKWTNDQYYGMLGLVTRVKTKNGRREGEFTVFAAPEGDVVQPLSGKVRPPQPLDGAALDPADPADRRAHLAAWLTGPDNAAFRRALVNRVWANFFGTALVDKPDDLRATNPASNEPLLAALAEQFRRDGHDVKKLIRLIATSAAYNRSAAPTGVNGADRRFYSRFFPRRLPAEVLADAVGQITMAPTNYPGYPAGWRALQLPDVKVDSALLDKFGRPERQVTCECERSDEPSVGQALHLSNGDGLNGKLRAPGGRVDRFLRAAPKGQTPDLAAFLNDLLLDALGRPPTAGETARLVAEWKTVPADERRAFLEDVCWGVLSSKEFLFNH